MSEEAFTNPLPGVPDVESPFFDEIFARKNLPPETMRIARQLREKGYAVLDFPDPQLSERMSRIKERLGANFDFDYWRRELWPKNDGLRTQDAWEHDQDVRAIATNPAIMKLLADLYGREPFPFQTLNFPVGTQQHVHNDAVHFSTIPDRFMCGVWLAMEDTDEENGALEYYPGSHRFPTYNNEHINACAAQQARPYDHYAQYGYLWRQLIRQSGLEREVFCAKKGQALIWSSHLLHGGSRHGDPARTRWSQVTHYYFDDCTYYTPMLSDPAYGTMCYRELRDIRTGQVKENRYGGLPVPREVIERSIPPMMKPDQGARLPDGFDPQTYLRLNEDVARAGVDPAKHYLEFGAREGRRWR